MTYIDLIEWAKEIRDRYNEIDGRNTLELACLMDESVDLLDKLIEIEENI